MRVFKSRNFLLYILSCKEVCSNVSDQWEMNFIQLFSNLAGLSIVFSYGMYIFPDGFIKLCCCIFAFMLDKHEPDLYELICLRLSIRQLLLTFRLYNLIFFFILIRKVI